MANSASRFVWYELMTTDMEAAKRFYTKIVGWGTQDMSQPGMAYTVFNAGAAPAAGLMNLPDDAKKMGAPPSWIGYVGVSDVNASAKKAERLGGRVHVQPRDIPNIGRFAVIADPQGATLSLFKGTNPEPPKPPEPRMPGRTGWNELLAVDWEKAFAFYGEMFGWQKADAIDMGAMGTYQMFSAGGQPIGGMFNKPATVPAPFWTYYFNVAGIDAAAERIKASGGKIMNGPMEVPGGQWIVQGTDPQGAMFALVGKRS